MRARASEHGRRRSTRAGSRTRTWMSRAEVADALQVAPVTVGRWASQGKLPYAVTLGGRRRFRREDIEVIVRELTRVSAPARGAAPRRHR